MAEETTKKDIGSVDLPEAQDRIDADKANRIVALIELDIAKFEVDKIRSQALVLQYDAAIAECRRSIADVNRRVANVDYPPAPEQPAEQPKPQMGEITGGAEAK